MTEDKSEKKSHDLLYLEKLTFRPELRKTWLGFFVSNFRVVILLIGLITIWGVYSFFQLPRESNPQVKIPIAMVTAAYPGASPADIEELVTKKIETGIAGVKGIKKITSSSANSVSSVVVEFESGEDITDSIRRLRDQVNSLKGDLPDDATEPMVNEISFDDSPILTIAITGPYDGFTLRRVADELKDDIEKIGEVREATVSGGDVREFEVAYDPQKLTFFGISADQANQAIQATNLAVPAGNFDGREYTYPVRSDARFFDVAGLENVALSHTDDGAVVMLKDIASVSEKAADRTIYSRLSIKGGVSASAVQINVVKKTGGNILSAIDEAKNIMDEKLPILAPDARYDVTTDYSTLIRRDFDQLIHDFLFTIALVFGILFLIVGLKEALVAGLAVPLVFFVTFGVMNSTGITLNFLSIFSLLLSMGLLVDDAIVVVTATKQYIRTGKFTPEEAVLLVLNDFKVVLTTTSLTTVWAFLPLLLATGIIGSFIKSIPITVSVTLIASLFIALMVNHPLAAVLERARLTKNIFFFCLFLLVPAVYGALSLSSVFGYILAAGLFALMLSLIRWYFRVGRPVLEKNAELMALEWEDDELIKKKLASQGKEHEKGYARFIHGILDIGKILPSYEKFLCRILVDKKKEWAVLGITLLVFLSSIALPFTGLLKSEFFPASDETILYVDMRAATGLKLDESNKIMARAEEKLLKYPEIINFSTTVGSSGGTASLSGNLGGGQGSSNLGSIVINLSDQKERDITSYDLAAKIREELKSIPEADFNVESVKGGPPAGAAFEARIIGDDLTELDRIARDLKPILESIPGAVDAEISLKESPAEYTFMLDPAKMELYSLNAAYVGSILRTAITGTEVTTVIKDGEEIKVIADFEAGKVPDLEAVQNLQMLNFRKQPVFIRDVAKIELKPSVETISRIDQKRTVLLSAGSDGRAGSNEIVAAFQKQTKDYRLPGGYSITYGGENEQNAESVKSIIKAMGLAFLLIISTLVIQFNSFKESLIVLVTIPLALIGVFFGLTISGISLSFPGLIGILALFGIVVKNAIILIDKINLNLKFGIGFEDSIVEAGKSRFEAILITSITTIAGIIPVTFSSELWRALGSAIIFGLMFSSFLTLFVVPILYSLLMRKSRFAKQNKIEQSSIL